MQWDDEVFPRNGQFELFDALASADKRLIARPGPHARTHPTTKRPGRTSSASTRHKRSVTITAAQVTARPAEPSQKPPQPEPVRKDWAVHRANTWGKLKWTSPSPTVMVMLRACCYRSGSADDARSPATDPATTSAEPTAILGLRRCTARAARRA